MRKYDIVRVYGCSCEETLARLRWDGRALVVGCLVGWQAADSGGFEMSIKRLKGGLIEGRTVCLVFGVCWPSALWSSSGYFFDVKTKSVLAGLGLVASVELGPIHVGWTFTLPLHTSNRHVESSSL